MFTLSRWRARTSSVVVVIVAAGAVVVVAVVVVVVVVGGGGGVIVAVYMSRLNHKQNEISVRFFYAYLKPASESRCI